PSSPRTGRRACSSSRSADREEPGMARAIYAAPVGASVALVATVPKTVLGVIAPAQFGIDLVRYSLGFDSVTAADKAVTVEFVSFTADGTGAAGTVAQ